MASIPGVTRETLEFIETGIPGCYEVSLQTFDDGRGSFVKTYRRSAFESAGFETDFAECFHTVSWARVLRGMHLQIPPADHAKLVYCTSGAVMDVSLDLRRGSPAFGRYTVIELGAGSANGVYLPRGVAHGFYVRSAPAVMLYHVTSEHVPVLDCGVRWDSFGAPWPDRLPGLSARDAALPALRDFVSPFHYGDGE
jgi:dTDP-4-dehydrorhamnose 3,5-epimerase